MIICHLYIASQQTILHCSLNVIYNTVQAWPYNPSMSELVHYQANQHVLIYLFYKVKQENSIEENKSLKPS